MHKGGGGGPKFVILTPYKLEPSWVREATISGVLSSQIWPPSNSWISEGETLYVSTSQKHIPTYYIFRFNPSKNSCIFQSQEGSSQDPATVTTPPLVTSALLPPPLIDATPSDSPMTLTSGSLRLPIQAVTPPQPRPQSLPSDMMPTRTSSS